MEKLQGMFHFLTRLFQSRWIRFVSHILVIIFCLVYLWMNFKDINDIVVDLVINYNFIVLSLLFTLFSIFLGVLSWWFILKGLGQTLSLIVVARTHLFSNLAKYLPGYGWQLIGKASLTNELGVSLEIVSFGMILELFQLLWSGFTIAIATAPSDLVLKVTGILMPSVYLHLIGLVSFALQFLFVAFLPTLLLKLRRDKINNNVDKRPMQISILCMITGWLSLGFAFWLLGAALSPVSILEIPFFVFVLASSMLSGLLVLVVPGGLGVRESVMVWILGSHISAPLAILVAALSRFLVLIGELISALLIKVLLQFPNLQQHLFLRNNGE